MSQSFLGVLGAVTAYVIVDQLTKSAHFIIFRVGQFMEVLAQKYM